MLHRLQHNRTDKICMAVYVTFFWALAIQYVLNPHPIPYMIADICPFSVLIHNFDCSHFVSCVTIHPRLRASPYIFWGCCCCCKQLGSLVSPRAWKSFLWTLTSALLISVESSWAKSRFPLVGAGTSCTVCDDAPHDCAARCKWARGAIDEVSTLAAAAATVCCVRVVLTAQLRHWWLSRICGSLCRVFIFFLFLLFFSEKDIVLTSQYGAV